MRLVRALLALGASSLFILLLLEVKRYIDYPSDYFEVEFNILYFAMWGLGDAVPTLCWLLVLLPLLIFSRVLDRWPLRRAGLLGFVTGAAVTTAILLVIAGRFGGTPDWKILAVLCPLYGIAVAIQFMVVNLTKWWAQAPVLAPAETESSGCGANEAT